MSEPDVTDLITVGEAIAILDHVPVRPGTAVVGLHEALGLRLARPIMADRDYPPFQKSLMDGYAIRSADAQVSVLRWIGEVRAGQSPERVVGREEAMSIMTGAPLPDGADAVVPIEFAERDGESIRLTSRADFTRFVAARGSDCQGGSTVLPRGVRMDAAQLAVAATVGAAEVEVFRAPRVAILATGDELADIDAPQIAAHQIRNSNSLMLQALLTRYGCHVTDLGIVRDEMPQLIEAIRRGLTFDALFITGGMSVGVYDLPPRALIEMGVKLHITKLKIKPGKPFLYGTVDDCHVIGLPGNPLAGFVCTVRLASRLLMRLGGGTPSDDLVTARLAAPLPANGPREFYQPAILDGEIAHPLAWKSSADVFTLARATALLCRPANDPAQSAGARCKVLPLP